MTRTDSPGTILIADSDFGDADIERAIVEGAGLRLLAAQCKSEDEVIEAGREADGVLTQYARVGSRAVAALTRCRVIARYGTGVDIVDIDAATRHGIQVTNAPSEWCAEEVADHAVALWLAAARKICRYDRATRQGEWHWKTGMPIHRLRGQVLGLLSFGAIARLIAERVKAFGVEVWAHDPFIDQSVIRGARVRPVSFDDLVEGSDHVVVQTPLTPQTHHTFDRATLRRMKPTAVLVNTARGPIVDDAALHQALTEGWIAGAALDDIEEEPAKQRAWLPTNTLLELPNVVVTPHAAYYSEEAVRTVRTIAAEEAVRVLTGQPARFPVNRLPAESRPPRDGPPSSGS
ncbi:C-terminal binding protein [Streptomyces sp. S465]|uniref:C-terminal binding protein n=1 Tax=Streptomyces sp. S465 TaxID=2979468 RepID=UPI0022A8714C|nr:C-terminal binding protein [Streptomyces sp. S465]WAP58812.1 C-terminal binding protein [Streptomyces sp. S465]